MTELRDYDPLQPRGGLNVKRILERAGALALLIGGTALKWGFVFAKFFAFFISIAAYKLWFGTWTFAVGFVLLILVHELGHAVLLGVIAPDHTRSAGWPQAPPPRSVPDAGR